MPVDRDDALSAGRHAAPPGGIREDSATPSGADLRRMHLKARLSILQIASRCGRPAEWVIDRLREEGVAVRGPGEWGRTPAFDRAVLWGLYVTQRQSVEAIAAWQGCSPETVESRLRTAGIPLRADPGTLDRQVLLELSVDQGLPVAAVARRFGTTDLAVLRALDEHGIPQRAPVYPVSEEILRWWSVEKGLSDREIAERTQCQPKTVYKWRVQWGIPTRPRRRIAEDLPVLTLSKLYVDQGLSLLAVAGRLNCSQWTVTDALRRHGLPVRPRSVDPEKKQRIVKLFGEGIVSVRAIAGVVGCGRATVEAVLDAAGLAWRGASVRRLPPEVDASVLADLYVTQRLALADIAARYAVPRAEVRRRLQELGIRRRRPPVLVPPPVVDLRAWYQREGLSVQAIAARHGVSPKLVTTWAVAAGRAPPLHEETPNHAQHRHDEHAREAAHSAQRARGRLRRARLIRRVGPHASRRCPLPALQDCCLGVSDRAEGFGGGEACGA